MKSNWFALYLSIMKGFTVTKALSHMGVNAKKEIE